LSTLARSSEETAGDRRQVCAPRVRQRLEQPAGRLDAGDRDEALARGRGDTLIYSRAAMKLALKRALDGADGFCC
jgi:hypothetical protein